MISEKGAVTDYDFLFKSVLFLIHYVGKVIHIIHVTTVGVVV